MNSMTCCEPADKIDDLLSRIQKYEPHIAVKNDHYLDVRLTSAYGDDLWIEIDGEFSIFFGDWHEHFFAYEEEYTAFLEDLFAILENRRFTICAYSGGKWRMSILSDTDIPDKAQLKKKYGEFDEIRCNFWNRNMNVVFADILATAAKPK